MAIEQLVIRQFEIPTDGRPHVIDLTSGIFHAACRRPGAIDVWAYGRHPVMQHMGRSFQVVVTDQPCPIASTHVATADSPDGQVVWHVLENCCQHQNVIEAPEMQDPPDRVPGICHDCQLHMVGNGHGNWIPA